MPAWFGAVTSHPGGLLVAQHLRNIYKINPLKKQHSVKENLSFVLLPPIFFITIFVKLFYRVAQRRTNILLLTACCWRKEKDSSPHLTPLLSRQSDHFHITLPSHRRVATVTTAAATDDRRTNLFIHLLFNGKGKMEMNRQSALIFPWRFHVFRKTIRK